jgi:adenylate cyclase
MDPHDVITRYNAVCVHAVLGDTDHAIDLLETLLPNSSFYQIGWFTMIPTSTTSATDPRPVRQADGARSPQQ